MRKISGWALGAVWLPDALSRKLPSAEREWSWQWIVPASSRWRDRATERRHHLHESVVQKAVRSGDARVRNCEAGDVPHLSPFVRDASSRTRAGHPDRAGAAGTPGCHHYHDLHARAGTRGEGSAEPAGSGLITGYSRFHLNRKRRLLNGLPGHAVLRSRATKP